jgi:hypothetical protein
MLILNVLAIVFFVIAFLIAQVVHLVFEPAIGPFNTKGTTTQLIQCGAIIVADLLYRSVQNREVGWNRFFYPSMGGALMFLPCWAVIGILAPIGFLMK